MASGKAKRTDILEEVRRKMPIKSFTWGAASQGQTMTADEIVHYDFESPSPFLLHSTSFRFSLTRKY